MPRATPLGEKNANERFEMKAIYIGGPLHDQSVVVADDCSDLVHEAENGARVRYVRRTWSKRLNESASRIDHSAYFVPDSLSEQEASESVIKHIQQHGPQ